MLVLAGLYDYKWPWISKVSTLAALPTVAAYFITAAGAIAGNIMVCLRIPSYRQVPTVVFTTVFRLYEGCGTKS